MTKSLFGLARDLMREWLIENNHNPDDKKSPYNMEGGRGGRRLRNNS